MGRNSTGCEIVSQVQRIELSYLLKRGVIKKGHHISSSLSWNNGGSINIETKYYKNEKYNPNFCFYLYK